jgi:hypothetical protein
VWDAVLDPPGRLITLGFDGGSQNATCATCGLVSGFWGRGPSEDGLGRALVQSDVYVRVELPDLRLEALDDEAIRVTHVPSGIVVEARAYPSVRDNYRAALQTLALQLRDRHDATEDEIGGG